MNMLVRAKQSKTNMRLIKFIICFILIFNLNNRVEALSGVGPVKFDEVAINHFFAYLRGDGNSKGEIGKKKGSPLAFAINPQGTMSHYYYCPTKYGSGGCVSADTIAVSECTKKSKARGGGKCKLFARGYKIVWGGANIKLSRKFDEEIVRTIFNKNGWIKSFGGDWSDKYIAKVKHNESGDEFKAMSSTEKKAKELATENCQSKYKNGCFLYSIKHKGETKTFANKEDTGQDTVKKLQDIKKMLDEGLVTEAEFKKLKEEILN